MSFFTWTPIELSANIFVATCIFLAGRNSIHTWWTGIVGSVLYGVMFFQSQLYADATLQIFFIITGVYGWIMWKSRGNSLTKELEVNRASPQYMLVPTSVAIVVALGYGWLLHSFTDAYAPWIDSAVLTFSVVAQLLLMARSIQTWQVWILVNTLSVPLFWSRELYLTSIMYGFFWCNAVYSYFYWKKLMKEESNETSSPSCVSCY